MTQRTLVLLRHAKAEAATGTPDVNRPLSARGHADAAAAGAWLGTHGYRPELVICSPARRTRQTWHAVAVALSDTSDGNPAPTVRYEPAAYIGDVADLLGLIQAASEDVTAVLLIGHNPTISQLAMLLDPDADLDSDGLRTCGIAVHRVTGGWADCGPARTPCTGSHTARG